MYSVRAREHGAVGVKSAAPVICTSEVRSIVTHAVGMARGRVNRSCRGLEACQKARDQLLMTVLMTSLHLPYEACRCAITTTRSTANHKPIHIKDRSLAQAHKKANQPQGLALFMLAVRHIRRMHSTTVAVSSYRRPHAHRLHRPTSSRRGLTRVLSETVLPRYGQDIRGLPQHAAHMNISIVTLVTSASPLSLHDATSGLSTRDGGGQAGGRIPSLRVRLTTRASRVLVTWPVPAWRLSRRGTARPRSSTT